MTLEKILRWVVLIGIFCLPFIPLIVSSSLFFPYITGKNFAFRILVEGIACAWLALALVDVRYRPRRGWILGVFALFVLLIAIADAQGANPFKSFWSNYERMDGWITIAHLGVYLVVASVVINTEKIWRRLFQLSTFVSAFISIYGFLQVYGAVALGEAGVSGLSARIDATFGNPIYLAVYMLFHVFIATLLIVQEGNERWSTMQRSLLPIGLLFGFFALIFTPQTKAVGLLFLVYLVFMIAMEGLLFLKKRYVLYFIIAIDTTALFFTGTRGTELGLIGGAILALLLFAFFQGTRRMRTIAGVSVLTVIVLGAGLHSARNSDFVTRIGFLQRLASVSLSDNTVHARFLNSQIAWQGVKERPLFGWGQENYAIVFDKYYNPEMYAQEPWFDRVHNIIFDWLVAGGFFGLFAYLSIFGVTIWELWRKNVGGTNAFSIAERSILTGLLAGYFFHNLTVFDNVTSYILFGTILAYIVWRINDATTGLTLPSRDLFAKSALPLVTLAMAIIAVVLVWKVNGTAIAQNTTLLGALEHGDLSSFNQAIQYGTFGTQEAREQLAQMSAQVASATGANITTDIKQQFFTTAVNEMALQAKASPLDARFPLFIGTVEDSYGDYKDAAIALAQAHTLSPKKQSILYQMGLNAQAMGDANGAEQLFKEAYELDTDNQQGLVYYIASAVRAGDETTADTLLTPAVLATGIAANQQLAAAYASRNEYAKIIPIWSAYITKNPTDTAAYTTLAAAYYQTGNSAAAIATFQQLIQVSPGSANQINGYIKQIQQGSVKTK
jgi:tetratricopeptide (TPR) repeat protein